MGVLPTAGAIQISLGKRPEGLCPVRTWTSAERAFISIPGKVRSLHGVEEARKLPRIENIFLRVEPGSRVRFPENNVTKCGNIISAAPTREEAVAAAEEAARGILVRLEAPEEESARFLSVPVSPELSFPPDAFKLPPCIYGRLDALPDPEPGGGSTGGDLCLLAFPEFLGLGIRDYMGRTVAESLEAVRLLTGYPLPLCSGLSGLDGTGRGKNILGRRFWAAMIRGGYQGAVYVVDMVGRRESSGT